MSVEKIIEYQQMQFDLSEIQARKFRKRLLENKGQIAKGMGIVDQLNNEIATELSELRLNMARETESGRNEQKVAEWKEKIAAELKALDLFRYENTKKIKLEK
ncbi:hypothetical protein LVD17_04870 [Fulvivirga ulvae]|uniref:hypothetical protein n=1 Tax=Fulvivirga ulvae TaxID=2904245 RepID=UPI001F294D4F|nr:hypothetical protein [Fulvivirga ulvae]UII33158.1 hypothetical protein LVD17_04870 [Fulvivirga ulvae]